MMTLQITTDGKMEYHSSVMCIILDLLCVSINYYKWFHINFILFEISNSHINDLIAKIFEHKK